MVDRNILRDGEKPESISSSVKTMMNVWSTLTLVVYRGIVELRGRRRHVWATPPALSDNKASRAAPHHTVPSCSLHATRHSARSRIYHVDHSEKLSRTVKLIPLDRPHFNLKLFPVTSFNVSKIQGVPRLLLKPVHSITCAAHVKLVSTTQSNHCQQITQYQATYMYVNSHLKLVCTCCLYRHFPLVLGSFLVRSHLCHDLSQHRLYIRLQLDLNYDYERSI
ncbi:hypothetical protein J6590_044344 [Homalodisca vitripennis]|nr:hypothetical protein J6590_044344 [Homalodisca vitripennis]